MKKRKPVQKLSKTEYRSFQNRMKKLSKQNSEAFKLEAAERIKRKGARWSPLKPVQKLSRIEALKLSE